MRYYYDLHLHSCLSPCGDDDMTPFNIANMAKLKGLDMIAITDHNSCRNAPAVIEAANEIGLLALAGMELTTSEDVHVLVLMPSLKAAEGFNAYVDAHRMRIGNRPDIYGFQQIMDARDNVIAQEDDLLISATDIGVYEAARLAESFGGVALPAHIDRESNGLVAVLGALDADMGFDAVEFSSAVSHDFASKYVGLGYNVVYDSDAHRLEDINESGGRNFLELNELNEKAVIAALKARKNSRCKQ